MSKLNAAQQAAVDHGDGPLLILAGAGSGKTRVITHRIASLLQAGVEPEAILAVSFTNKAANEMAERMVPLCGKRRARAIVMSTFHSFGLSLLKEDGDAIGLDGRFVIFDQGDSLGVAKDILRELHRSGAARKLDPMAILARISNWKSALMTPQEVPEAEFEYDDVAREVYPEYVARLAAMKAVDFDDLVAAPVRILREHPPLRRKWQERFEHVLVDEFQDTSRVQLELIKLLANARRNVCVVGDDDQSIYSWRGADVGNILEFERHFPGAVVVKLEQNYRSRAPVLAVANAVITQSSTKRHDKTLRSVRGIGDCVRLCELSDPTEEARFVAREVNDLRREGVRLTDIAVLYRSNLQARLIEEEFRAGGVAYRLFGGTQFFDRKEVKDAAAYLRVVVNPRDEISLRRILNYPPRGIGARSVERIGEFAKEHRIPFARALAQAAHIDGVPDNARRAIGQLLGVLDGARERLDSTGRLHGVARELFEQVDLRGALMEAADGGTQGAVRAQNLDHVVRWLERYEGDGGSERRSLQGFLERITLRGDPKEEESASGVTLSTLHASKGLEFPYVFLIGCVEGQLPHSRTTDPKSSEAVAVDVDEERRLFYVGVTRAQERLYLCRPKERVFRGKSVKLTPSRFLHGLPDTDVQNYERAETQSLDFGEIAELGREFLRKHKAKGTGQES